METYLSGDEVRLNFAGCLSVLPGLGLLSLTGVRCGAPGLQRLWLGAAACSDGNGAAHGLLTPGNAERQRTVLVIRLDPAQVVTRGNVEGADEGSVDPLGAVGRAAPRSGAHPGW